MKKVFFENSFAFAKIILSYDILKDENIIQKYTIQIPLDEKEFKKVNYSNKSLLIKDVNLNKNEFYIEKNILLWLGVFYFTKLMRKLLRTFENKNIQYLTEDNLHIKVKQLEAILQFLLADKYYINKDKMMEKIKLIVVKISENIKNFDPNKKELILMIRMMIHLIFIQV